MFLYAYSGNTLSARFFAVDRTLNFYYMIMICDKSNDLFDKVERCFDIVAGVDGALGSVHTTRIDGPCSWVNTRVFVPRKNSIQRFLFRIILFKTYIC